MAPAASRRWWAAGWVLAAGLLLLAPRSDAMMQQGHITIRMLENFNVPGAPTDAPLVGWGVWVGPAGSYGTDGHPTDDNGQWTFNVMPGLYDTGYMMGMAPYDYPPFQTVSVGPNESVTVTYVLTRLHFDPSVEVPAPTQPWGNWHGVPVRLTWVPMICDPLHLRAGYEEQHWGLNHEGILLKQEGTLFDGDTSTLDLMNHIVATFTGPGGRTGYVAELDFPWDTTWCYNNAYEIVADAVFQDFWNPSPPGPGLRASDGKPVTLRNVVVKDVAAQPGTSDVIQFDPNAPENDPLRAPQISFTIEDEGDTRGPYTWKVYLRNLQDGNWETGDYAVIAGDAGGPGAVGVTVNSPAAGQTQDESLTAKGVYAYDVVVQELGPPSMPGPPGGGGGMPPGGGGGELVVVDDNWAKSPYRLKVPGTPPGFHLRLVHNAQGQVEARFDYTLEDTLNAVEAQVELLGPDFTSLASAALDPTVGVAHENELLYSFAAAEWQPGATYYAVITGVDQHGVDDPPFWPYPRWYRVRDVNKRMLAVTAEAFAPALPEVEIVQVGEGDPIGGTVPVVVKVTAGGECPMTGFTVKVVAECPVNDPDPEAELTGAWYSDAACTQASGQPGENETRWWKGEWNTVQVPKVGGTEPPMPGAPPTGGWDQTHNDPHKVTATLAYRQTWNQQDRTLADEASRQVTNLVIAQVEGPVTGLDYFPYNPADANTPESTSFTITMEDNDFSEPVTVRFELRSTKESATVLRTIELANVPSAMCEVTWDGTIDDRPAEPGMYTYEIVATQAADGDSARYRSVHLTGTKRVEYRPADELIDKDYLALWYTLSEPPGPDGAEFHYWKGLASSGDNPATTGKQFVQATPDDNPHKCTLPGSEVDGDLWVVLVAGDNHGADDRCHQPRLMLPQNERNCQSVYRYNLDFELNGQDPSRLRLIREVWVRRRERDTDGIRWRVSTWKRIVSDALGEGTGVVWREWDGRSSYGEYLNSPALADEWIENGAIPASDSVLEIRNAPRPPLDYTVPWYYWLPLDDMMTSPLDLASFQWDFDRGLDPNIDRSYRYRIHNRTGGHAEGTNDDSVDIHHECDVDDPSVHNADHDGDTGTQGRGEWRHNFRVHADGGLPGTWGCIGIPQTTYRGVLKWLGGRRGPSREGPDMPADDWFWAHEMNGERAPLARFLRMYPLGSLAGHGPFVNEAPGTEWTKIPLYVYATGREPARAWRQWRSFATVVPENMTFFLP